MNAFQQSVLSLVVNQITEADTKQFQKEIDSLVTKNKELLGPDTADGFIYGDRWFTGSGVRGRANQSLHPSLVSTASRVMDHLKTVTDDQRIMTQVLGKLVESCHTMEDMRNELPEVVISLDPSMWMGLSRTREPAQSIRHDARAVRQYEKVLGKIHSYCAMRFLL